MNERVQLRIAGRVQGVFYRASAQKAARDCGLRGWVRNAADGSVEALAEGPREQLEKFIAWCRKGPPAASVDDLQASWTAASGEFDDFSITR